MTSPQDRSDIRIWTKPWKVTGWIDGDTCHGIMDDGWGRFWIPKPGLRLLLGDGGKYDAPERKEKTRHLMALNAITTLAPVGRWFMVTSHHLDPDDFGRPLCSIQLPDGRDLATTMVSLGHVK